MCIRDRTLHKVLDDWYPGCAQGGPVQRWKGARPMLPDGPPVLGPSGAPGVWLNLGHGSSGWALCGLGAVMLVAPGLVSGLLGLAVATPVLLRQLAAWRLLSASAVPRPAR